MAVQNQLTAKKQDNQLMTFMANGMEVKLTPATVKNYLVSGDANKVTTQEIVMFMNLCKFNGLNPWLREAYCIKYGNSPATMVTGRAAYEKRAEEHPQYDGMKAGIVVVGEEGEIQYREGMIKKKDEELLGGWAEVYRKDRKNPYRIEVDFDEYAGRKPDGSLNSQWAKKPATMIRKVALVQALREAFPKMAYEGFVSQEETGDIEIQVDVTPVAQPENIENQVEHSKPEVISEPPKQPEQAQDDIEAMLFGGN